MGDPRCVVVVGASRAGLSAVAALRQHGFGGDLILIGAERWLPYDRPALSKGLLAGAFEPDDLGLCEKDGLADVDVRLGTGARRLDVNAHEVELEDGSSVRYERLLVATGVSARPLLPSQLPRGVHMLRSLDDGLALRAGVAEAERLVIVGGGFIGCEVAATLSGGRLGITLIEAGPTLLGQQLGQHIGAAATRLHVERGIDVICGVGVAGFADRSGHVSGVRLTDGRLIPADTVVVGVGATPNVDWLPEALVDGRHGVLCESTLQCAPDVYAAGDLASWVHPLFGRRMRVEHWTNAHEQARVAAGNMLGIGETIHAAVPYVWSDQYGSRIQAYGDLRHVDWTATVCGAVDEWRFVQAYGCEGKVVAAIGVDMARELLHLRRAIAEGGDWSSLPVLA